MGRNKKTAISFLRGGFMAGAWVLGALPAQAATVSYLLEDSNHFTSGAPYVRVTVGDTGAPGAINFTVTPLAALDPFRSGEEQYGIHQFGFHGRALALANIAGVPASWEMQPGYALDKFGAFMNVLHDRTHDFTQNPLVFSIVGIDGDTIADYAPCADKQSSACFAAKVHSVIVPGRPDLDYAYVGGGSAVPLPAAVWLFGSGLLGLIGVARRNRRATR